MTPTWTRYIPHSPTARQAAFLCLPHREALYGGAAGGGKSDALLMAALQYVDVPGYAALILRRSYADLALPGAIMDRAHSWLAGTDAKWDGNDKTYTFPKSGATLTFGYLQTERDKYRYQSSEFQSISFDELTQFSEAEYTFLFSRLRRSAGVNVPLRMRAGSNPGGVGHDWVRDRFIVNGQRRGRAFIPARLEDNPYLDQKAYEESLAEMSDLEQAQLRHGDWGARPEGGYYKPEWWERGLNRYSADDHRLRETVVARWLSFDTAFREGQAAARSACLVVEMLPDYRILIRDAWARRLDFPALLGGIRDTANAYSHDEAQGRRKLREVIIEDKASGISAIQTLRHGADSDWLADAITAFSPGTLSKEQRAAQASLWCQRGMVLLPEPSAEVPWLLEFEQELFGFPNGLKDYADAFAQVILYLEHFLADGWQARERRAA